MTITIYQWSLVNVSWLLRYAPHLRAREQKTRKQADCKIQYHTIEPRRWIINGRLARVAALFQDWTRETSTRYYTDMFTTRKLSCDLDIFPLEFSLRTKSRNKPLKNHDTTLSVRSLYVNIHAHHKSLNIPSGSLSSRLLIQLVITRLVSSPPPFLHYLPGRIRTSTSFFNK